MKILAALAPTERVTVVEAARHFATHFNNMDYISLPAGGVQLDSVDLGQQLRAQGGAAAGSTDGELDRNNVAQPLDGADMLFQEEVGGERIYTCTLTITYVCIHLNSRVFAISVFTDLIYNTDLHTHFLAILFTC